MDFRLTFILALLLVTSTTPADEHQPYATFQSITYSKPLAIKALADDWEPPFYGGDRALTYDKIEAGVRWRGWQLGILERYDYLMEFSAQTAEFVYLIKNRIPLQPGREYQIYLKAIHNRSQGIRLGRTYKFTSTLSGGLALAYLRSKAFTDGTLWGSARASAEKDYDFQFDTDYVYSRDVLFDRHVDAPIGQGFNLDLSLAWQPSEAVTAQLDIIDLAGRMYWDEAPYTLATASSDTKSFDEQGYVRYDPVISGFESDKRFIQTLPRKTFLAAQYRYSDEFEAVMEYRDFQIQHFTSIGVGWRYKQKHHFQTLYTPTTNALTLRYLRGKLHLELSADHVKINRIRYFTLQLSYNYTL